MLAACEDFSRELGFQFSPSKCEIVGPADAEGYSDCCLYGQPLKSAQSFVYLGVTFSLSGIDPVAHVTRNATKAIDSIRRIYETFVRPSYWSRVERYCASWRGPSTRHYVPCSRPAATGAVLRCTG